jgi:DNA invertase Pin-like site-specific DNA recombinase
VPSKTRAEVERRIEAGEKVRDIALALGITTQAVYKHLKASGIAPPTRGAA